MIIYNKQTRECIKCNYNVNIGDLLLEITENEYKQIELKENKEKQKQLENSYSEYISNLKKEYEILSKTMSDEAILIIAPKYVEIIKNKPKKKTT